MNAFRLRRLAALASLLVVVGTGCTAANLGIRPDQPPFVVTANPCDDYEKLVNYSQDLQEAYHSRASQNRAWIYVAGGLALGAAAATGGLGAAGAATLTIALVSVSGGFTSGLFAMIENSTLADIYSMSANEIATALDKSRALLKYRYLDKGAPKVEGEHRYELVYDPNSCASARNELGAGVTSASNKLESARTNSAVAAVLRAEAEVKKVKAIAKEIEAAGEEPEADVAEPGDAAPPDGDAIIEPPLTADTLDGPAVEN